MKIAKRGKNQPMQERGLPVRHGTAQKAGILGDLFRQRRVDQQTSAEQQ